MNSHNLSHNFAHRYESGGNQSFDLRDDVDDGGAKLFIYLFVVRAGGGAGKEGRRMKEMKGEDSEERM